MKSKRKPPLVSETLDESSSHDSNDSDIDQTKTTDESDTNIETAYTGSYKRKAHKSWKYSTYNIYNGTKNFMVWYKQFRYATKGLSREEKLALLQLMRELGF